MLSGGLLDINAIACLHGFKRCVFWLKMCFFGLFPCYAWMIQSEKGT
ncbi:hypothetical protein DDI_3643 [Dickeya dianthicola RNS04.9]|nr:hypothetical protein DDI_3643 [Dickeya dianthicola RNS04.9]